MVLLEHLATQDISRNKWGKTIEQVIGINPILSKEKNFNNLNDIRQELLEKIGLTFNEFGEVVVGYVDIKNYITLFPSLSGVQSAVQGSYTFSGQKFKDFSRTFQDPTLKFQGLFFY